MATMMTEAMAAVSVRRVVARRAASFLAPLVAAVALTAVPAARAAAQAATVTVDAAAERSMLRDGRSLGGRADAVASTPALFGGFRAFLAASAERPAAGVVRDRLAATARLSYAFGGAFGVWTGYDVSRARLLGAVVAPNDPVVVPPRTMLSADSVAPDAPPPDEGRARPSGTLGLWWQRRAAVLSLSFATGSERTAARAARYEMRTIVDSFPSDSGWVILMRDSAFLVAPGRAARARRIGDAEARLAWSAGRLALDGAVGARFVAGGVAARAAWGGMGATLAVGPHASLVLGGGVRPTPLASRLLRERYVSAGVRVSPMRFFARPPLPVGVVRASAASFDLRAVGGGRYVVRVRVPGARVVELSGDFTGWRPVALTRVGRDGWELVLPLAPGTHHLNIRVDGDAWVAPPGASTVADDFNGTVGVVVVP